LGPDPAHPRAQEEDEALLRAEFEAERSGDEIVLDVTEEDLGAGAGRELARVAVEVVTALEVERGREAPLEGNVARSAAHAESRDVVVHAAIEAEGAVRAEDRREPGPAGEPAVELQPEVADLGQVVPAVRGTVERLERRALRVGSRGRRSEERA